MPDPFPTPARFADLPDQSIDLATGAGIESRWVQVDGQRIHYRHSPGSGPALLLLQGGLLDSSALTWRRVLEGLPPFYRVFAPDLPGYGESAKPEEASYTTAYYVRFIEHFLDAVDVPRASVFGSSMSGAIVLGFALQCPARAEALVLSGAYGFQERFPFHELAYLACRLPGIARLTRAVLRLHPAVLYLVFPLAVRGWHHVTPDLVADAYAGVLEPRAFAAFFRWMRSDTLPHRVRSNYTDRLPELRMPVLLLHGEHDWTMPVAYARRAARLLPNAVLHTFPDCAHLVPRERPEAASASVQAFLRRVLTDGSTHLEK